MYLNIILMNKVIGKKFYSNLFTIASNLFTIASVIVDRFSGRILLNEYLTSRIIKNVIK